MKLFSGTIFFLFSSLLVLPAFSADFYKWVDENGSIHFTGSYDDVPESYRKRALGGAFKTDVILKELDQTFQTKGISSKSRGLRKYILPYKGLEGISNRVIVDVTFYDRITVPMVLDTLSSEVTISERLHHKLVFFDRDPVKLNTSVYGERGTPPTIRTILSEMEVGGIKNRFIPAKVIPHLSNVYEGVIVSKLIP